MEKVINTKEERIFLDSLKDIVKSARKYAYSSICFAQVQSNWMLGKRIVEQIQKGNDKAEYGKHILKIASESLTEEFGKGYSETNLKSFRKFYLIFKDYSIGQTMSEQLEERKQQTLSAKLEDSKRQATPAQLENSNLQALPVILSWTHYERLMRIKNKEIRDWYMKEAAEQMWNYRTLNRNINTQYYERMLISQKKTVVENEMIEKTKTFQNDKLEFIKNPTVLEFLGLPNNLSYLEKDLEKAILSNLSDFLMELGKGFAFVARQQLIRTEEEDYYIDLVFYNYILKAFVLIDLKVGKITHQDVGQMDMYVRMYDELKKGHDDNPTIGILLCAQTDKDIAKYSILKGNEHIFASKYKLILPTEEELANEIKKQREIYLDSTS
jgi:predicted nuclease of restriction endonuclease-like (RecB) superfamily